MIDTLIKNNKKSIRKLQNGWVYQGNKKHLIKERV
jgi:hypothetical protein